MKLIYDIDTAAEESQMFDIIPFIRIPWPN